MSDRFAHLAAVIGGVVAAAARDAGRSRVIVVDWAPPESALLERCLESAGVDLPLERVGGADLDDARARAWRAAGTDGLLANPVSRTVAVLWPELLGEPLLPLADLAATQVMALAGGWSAPPGAVALIERAGGIEAVDGFLVRLLDERRPFDVALAGIADVSARAELADRYRAGRWWRRRAGVVPKLGERTLGLDLR